MCKIATNKIKLVFHNKVKIQQNRYAVFITHLSNAGMKAICNIHCYTERTIFMQYWSEENWNLAWVYSY